jgi:hypothetical protein
MSRTSKGFKTIFLKLKGNDISYLPINELSNFVKIYYKYSEK